ncbi:class I SAM-dependent methyltransferase [Methylobacterium sp. EM32]|uniref:class I SAM-dependent methyltransferase n=1 Tax=Methylobacterium sp. EM32 TaxID=3163481 RepID=UPI0033A3DDE0
MSPSLQRNVVSDHAGIDYQDLLAYLHRELRPRNYLEIGTRHGGTLALSGCRSIAIDPHFQFTDPAIFSSRPVTLLYQLTSDEFFASHDARALFGEPIQLAFLDGMHRCEFLLRDFYNTEAASAPNSVIAIHDCLPVEIPMTSREEHGIVPVEPHRAGWWTGDVWRTALLLKRERPDLDILALDAHPTGLIIVTNLDPGSTRLKDNYNACVRTMLSYDLSEMTIAEYFAEMQVQNTSCLDSSEKLTARYWL